MSNIDPPPCYRCQAKAKLRRNLTANGMDMFGWYCTKCERWAVKNQAFVTRDFAEKVVSAWNKTLGDVPAVGIDGYEPCLICGETHTEVHHFAPQEFADRFDNWTAWPTGPALPEAPYTMARAGAGQENTQWLTVAL